MKNLLSFSFVFMVFIANAQHHQMCGTDEMAHQLYHSSPPHLQQLMAHNRQYLHDFTAQFIKNNPASRSGNDSVYYIPVVFHVIHNYGTENISDEQLMSGLKVLNQNIRLRGPDTATIVPAFKSIAADCDIEFVLAHRDPTGRCHSGINRFAALSSTIGDHRVKDIVHWNPANYLNIYVVKNINNLAGHCLMPDQAAAKPEWDGIVMSHQYLGDIGTSNPQRSVVMAHEAGHYLNLFHIWGGNNVPGYFYLPVGQASNCAVGDSVADTPPTTGWSICNLTAASCGNTVDNVQNAMDYSYCNFMFTQGQRARMRASLNSPMANRNNLIKTQNHISTGIFDSTLCSAKIKVPKQTVCIGDTLFLFDASLRFPTSWRWYFGDGNTSTLQNPTHIYSQPGTFYVYLEASQNGVTLKSDSVMIRVTDIGTYPFYVQDFETINTLEDAWLWNITDNDSLRWKKSTIGQGFNSDYSIALRPNDSTDMYSGRSTIYSEAVNLFNVNSPEFNFKYAFSRKVANNIDQLEVFMSNDCGKNWISVGRRTGNTLNTAPSLIDNKNWTPVDSTQWKTFAYTIPNANATYNFLFKIEYTNYRGNVLYIDNINVNAKDYTNIDEVYLNETTIYPNPTNDVIFVYSSLDKLDYELFNITGALLDVGKITSSKQEISLQNLSSGVYTISLKSGDFQVRKRVVRY